MTPPTSRSRPESRGSDSPQMSRLLQVEPIPHVPSFEDLHHNTLSGLQQHRDSDDNDSGHDSFQTGSVDDLLELRRKQFGERFSLKSNISSKDSNNDESIGSTVARDQSEWAVAGMLHRGGSDEVLLERQNRAWGDDRKRISVDSLRKRDNKTGRERERVNVCLVSKEHMVQACSHRGVLLVNFCAQTDGAVLHDTGEIKECNSDEEATEERVQRIKKLLATKPPLKKKGSLAIDLLVNNLVRVRVWCGAM